MPFVKWSMPFGRKGKYFFRLSLSFSINTQFGNGRANSWKRAIKSKFRFSCQFVRSTRHCLYIFGNALIQFLGCGTVRIVWFSKFLQRWLIVPCRNSSTSDSLLRQCANDKSRLRLFGCLTHSIPVHPLWVLPVDLVMVQEPSKFNNKEDESDTVLEAPKAALRKKKILRSGASCFLRYAVFQVLSSQT